MAAEVVRTGRSLGFDGVIDSFPSLRDKLLAGVPAKIKDAEVGLRGSAIHWNKWNDSVKVHDGPFFDTARGAGGSKQPSDFDFFVVSPELTRRGIASGVIRDPNSKSPLSEDQLKELGLGRLDQVLEEIEGRKGNIRLFPSRKALESEGSFMLFVSPEKVR